MMTVNATHQYAQDKVAQDHVEGRSPTFVGFDFGVELPPQMITVNAAGAVVDVRPVDTLLDIEKRRQDVLVSRMEDRANAWRRMRDWLTGGLCHGR